MLGRRSKDRVGTSDRRDLPRPSLRINLLLLAAAVSALSFAARQRGEIEAGYARAFDKTSAGSPELNQVKAELAELDLDKDALDKELDSRLAYLENRKAKDFFLSIDTAKRKLYMNYGNDVVRDADVRVGAGAVVEGPDGKALSVVLKGAFSVTGKREDDVNGKSKYVIYLPNEYVIYSPPGTGSRAVRPGSFMVPEADLKAIWDRILPETRVYIF